MTHDPLHMRRRFGWLLAIVMAAGFAFVAYEAHGAECALASGEIGRIYDDGKTLWCCSKSKVRDCEPAWVET